jgi:hypothetical protein
MRTLCQWKIAQPLGDACDSAEVWAFKDRAAAAAKAETGAAAWGGVWGAVRLWGEIVEHDCGYRAENARIVAIEGV